MRRLLGYTLSLTLLALPACSSPGPDGGTTVASMPAPTEDAATRKSPVVIGRPARVFIFAGLGDACETLNAPEINVKAPPTKGDLSFVPGQQTTIQHSATGKCIGRTANGTGVYYTARPDTSGTDRFMLEAKLATGEVSTRTFEVTIAN